MGERLSWRTKLAVTPPDLRAEWQNAGTIQHRGRVSGTPKGLQSYASEILDTSTGEYRTLPHVDKVLYPWEYFTGFRIDNVEGDEQSSVLQLHLQATAVTNGAQTRKRRRFDLSREVDGRWIGSIVVGFTSTGRQRRKTVSAETRREAVAKLSRLQRDIAGGHDALEDARAAVGVFMEQVIVDNAGQSTLLLPTDVDEFSAALGG